MFSDDQWLEWLDELAEKDFVVVDDFISEEMFSSVMSFFRSAEENDKLKKAGIGSTDDFTVKPEVRGDFIYWLDEDRDQQISVFFNLMTELQEKLRRFCFLSLAASEFHIAKYPAGSHYDKHLDQFTGRNNRLITVLIYLNEHWKEGDGGELLIHGFEKEIKIPPVARRLLLFKSDVIEHEVLKTNVPRYSLTGWLLHKDSAVVF
ncbi:2OG-Fe(II) oxygenase [Balneola sp. MJW-20]|uniref:2OG-Fe(II) oxygenase n=1 Tax=Gracilimonas aurantiaca TaxID=3234185 RepID=UPI003465F94A